MKIRVTSEFYDKFNTSTLFKVGTVLDFDDDRAKDVIAKGLAEAYVEPKKEEAVKPSLKAEKKSVKGKEKAE